MDHAFVLFCTVERTKFFVTVRAQKSCSVFQLLVVVQFGLGSESILAFVTGERVDSAPV